MILMDLFKVILDKKHVKDVRNWILIVLVGSFYCYHTLIIKPMQERLERVGKKTWQIIKVAKLQAKIDALPKDDRR